MPCAIDEAAIITAVTAGDARLRTARIPSRSDVANVPWSTSTAVMTNAAPHRAVQTDEARAESRVIVPITDGRLDLGPWQQIFYCEFDGGRSKRLVIKVLGE